MENKMQPWQQFIINCREVIPGLQVKYKDESKFWKMLPETFRKGATTFGNVIWMASREAANDPENEIDTTRTAMHEVYHAEDFMLYPASTFAEYAMPQVLVLPLMAIAITAAAFLGWGWWSLLCLIPLLALLPWPSSPWRLKLEIPAYAVGVWFDHEIALHIMGHNYDYYKKLREFLKRTFMSRLYFRMIWREKTADSAIVDVLRIGRRSDPFYKSEKLKKYARICVNQINERKRNGRK
jgi:hypothetical protein